LVPRQWPLPWANPRWKPPVRSRLLDSTRRPLAQIVEDAPSARAPLFLLCRTEFASGGGEHCIRNSTRPRPGPARPGFAAVSKAGSGILFALLLEHAAQRLRTAKEG